MTADILREKFLAFFKARIHRIIESDSLVPKDDPTVLFTPAGMNQFKREFLGFDSGFKRAATAQRCLRTDDLDKVGKTNAHHTFFEMLGNFSFGDYFKEDAILWAWEFLTRELKIDADKLWVSVYQDDAEAYQIWRDLVGVPAEKIVKLGDKENFWPAEAKTKGPNGPCGPCSEIFYDFGKSIGCGKTDCTPACSCGRFVEIWNLVFTQFNREKDASLVPLPHKNIDTGMGLERLAAVMEGKLNNFETELFEPIIKEIVRGRSLKRGQSPQGPVPEKEFLYAISDHIRAIVFSIYDGIMPSNDGRGYVVRKIIRKSILHLRSLGIDGPFLNKLIPLVAKVMRKPYPDLTDRQEDIAQVILNEEKRFSAVLNNAPDTYKAVFGAYNVLNAKAEPAVTEISKKAFELYDTYGIPLELTKGWLDSNGLKYNEVTIAEEFKAQKDRSRAKSVMKGDVFATKGLGLKLKETKFVGYKDSSSESKVLAVLNEGDTLKIILNRTPFYAESGGQVGDSGELIKGKSIFDVLDTQKIDNLILHIGKIKSGTFKEGDAVTAKVNSGRRLAIARNHTATHILQAALRKVLGPHLKQQGSLVDADRLRFDFTHFKGLSEEELNRVEEVVNSYIKNKYAVSVKEMTLQDAKKTKALAFFEEKYGAKVRVVSVADISSEFCGGTHLKNTGEIGLFKITRESSVASGVRRIEAVTADFAKRFIKEEEQRITEESKKENELTRLKDLEKQRSIGKSSNLRDALPRVLEKCVKINGINAIASLEDSLDMDSLRRLTDMIKGSTKETVIALGSEDKSVSRAFLVVGITADLLDRGLDAVVLIRQAAKIIGGSGGGRKDFAQAGGNKPENLSLALEELRKAISR